VPLPHAIPEAPVNATDDNVPRVSVERLRAFIADAFVAAGLPDDDSRALGELIAEADLRGIDTHGVFRMPLYVRRIRAGGINPRPDIRIIEERPSTALLDGDNGMGHLVMRRAAELAIAKAKQNGVGWVGAP
jgi:L-2-hydroxycarboxylate dehydrogenase (NAD+)